MGAGAGEACGGRVCSGTARDSGWVGLAGVAGAADTSLFDQGLLTEPNEDHTGPR